MDQGILQGSLVVEVASVLAGPSAGMFLAEQGARVIKIENPSIGGDVTRGWRLPSENKADLSAYFCTVNWGKESLTLNLKSPEDQAFLHSILHSADFLLTSFLPGQAERLGLGTALLVDKFPSLIMGEINGYGIATSRPAFDAIIQAEAGFTYLNGLPQNTHKMPVALMDVLAAHQLCQGLLLAYIKRLKTGEGSRISVSLLQAGLSGLINQASNWLVAGQVPEPMGSAHPNIVPYGTQYQTSDGQAIVLAVGNDRQFEALAEILGIVPEERWTTNAGRVLDRVALEPVLEAAFAQQPAADLMAAFQARNIPAGMVKRMPEALSHPLALEILLDTKGVRRFVGTGLPKVDLSAPPELGEHSAAIRREFGD